MNKKYKTVKVLTIACIIICTISIILNFLLPFIMFKKISAGIDIDRKTSIIGGADGPTSIYIASEKSYYLITFIFGLLSIIGIVYLIIKRKQAEN